MARELILNLNKNKSTFGISKIDRKKLYGFKKRLFLDEKESKKKYFYRCCSHKF